MSTASAAYSLAQLLLIAHKVVKKAPIVSFWTPRMAAFCRGSGLPVLAFLVIFM
jgi:hypothetical protein